MTHETSFTTLSDQDLIVEARRLAANERTATATLIACLAELDARRLHLGMGYSSLHDYCAKALHLTDYAGYARIEAARAARRFPLVLDLLRDGSINLTTITLLGRHLTTENHERVLRAAMHKSKREIEVQVAALRPLPDVPAIIRKLPVVELAVGSSAPPSLPEVSQPPLPEAETVATPIVSTVPEPPPAQVDPPKQSTWRPALVTPLAPQRYKVQLTIGQETHDKLRRVQDLLRHCVPSGDPAVIFDRALTVLLRDLQRRKLATIERARADSPGLPGSRHVPASVKRAVWGRDGGQCAFIGTEGRCTARGFLELHHVEPFALGGPTTVENLQLRCRAHNAYEAEMEFGSFMLREEEAGYLATQLGPDPVERAIFAGPWAEIFVRTSPFNTYARTKPACRCAEPTRPGAKSTWLMVTSQPSIDRFGRSNLVGARGDVAGVCASASRVGAISSANTAKAARAFLRVMVIRESHGK